MRLKHHGAARRALGTSAAMIATLYALTFGTGAGPPSARKARLRVA